MLTTHVHREGTFRITAGRGWTELVVREGLAELVTDRGSRLVHAGEMGWIEDHGRSRIELADAGRYDALERWGDRLTAEASLTHSPYVDRSLRYAAAPLAEHGGWVEIGHRRAWRPRVETSWRPYYRGHWRHTPVGLTWVSYDPWGWVTHHYGSWDYADGYGWVWYPGHAYAPARVHWYWGPSYVGWVPSGYYGHHYRRHHHGFGLRFGLYGWAGGPWRHFAHWTFTATFNFGRHHHHHYRRGHRYDWHHHYRRGHRHDHERRGHHYYSGDDLARERPDLERGVITTDPGIGSRPPKDAPEVLASLERQLAELRRSGNHATADVTDFVARKPLASETLTRAVLSKPAKPGVVSSGGWSTGEKPLPVPRIATKPTTKPTEVTANKPVLRPSDSRPSGSRPSVSSTDAISRTKPERRDYSKPVGEVGRSKPSVSSSSSERDRWTKPSKPAVSAERPYRPSISTRDTLSGASVATRTKTRTRTTTTDPIKTGTFTLRR